MDASFGDYYRRLRVPRTASRQEIKTAFRRLARQYHPDLHPNEPSAVAKFQALREAYEVLVDRVQRHRYDQQLAQENDLGNGQKATPQDTQTPRENARKRRPPQTPTDFYIQGIHNTLAHRYSTALKDYSEAIALDSNFAEAYLRRAEVRYVLEDDSGVLADCQQAIAINSTEAKTYYYQGLARYRLGYVQSAIAAFTHAVACDPEDARTYRWRGIAYQDLHDMDDAAKDFRRSAQLYRSQGDMVSAQAAAQQLRTLGPAGLAWPQQLVVRTLNRLMQPLVNRLVRRPKRRWLGRTPKNIPFPAETASERSPERYSYDEFPMDRGSTPSEPPPYKPWNRSTVDQSLGNQSPLDPPARARRRPSNADQPSPFRQAQYWAPGISSRPETTAPWPVRLRKGAFNLLKLMSNPGGEMVALYRRLPEGKHTLIGYGLAVLANLCFVFGASRYFINSSWLLASCLWAVGAFTFVAMVLSLSLARWRLRIQGLWAADIFILGTALLPLGLFSLVAASLLRVAASLRMISGELGDPVLLISLGFAAMWAFSHAFIVLHAGLSQIHRFPMRISAWLAPVILSFGLGVGLAAWMIFAI